MLLSNMLFITIYENIPILVLLHVIIIKEEEILSFNREKCFVSITVMLLIYESPRALFWSWQKRKSVKTYTRTFYLIYWLLYCGLTCFTEITWQLWHEQFLDFRGILRPDMISVVSLSICYICKAFLNFVSLPLYDIRATGNDACGHPHGWETNISSIYTPSQHQSFKSALANFAMQWKQPKPLLLGWKTWKSSHIFKCCDIAGEKKHGRNCECSPVSFYIVGHSSLPGVEIVWNVLTLTKDQTLLWQRSLFFKLEIFDFVKFVKNNLKFVETCKKCQTRVNLPKVPENVLF